jgi:hypothetical protein
VVAYLSVRNVQVGENDGFVDMVVSLGEPSAQPVSVGYATSGDSARPGTSWDYSPVAGTLNFAPGETTKTVRIELMDESYIRSRREKSKCIDSPRALRCCRNGQLSLHHHDRHRLSVRKLAALTAVRNFHIRRPDGTTAAERFFGRALPLVEHLIARTPLPPRPRRRRPPTPKVPYPTTT